MDNSEIAKILNEIGEYLEMQGVAFKPAAYEKASQSVGALEESVADIYARGDLKAVEEIPGVGVSIAEKIEELLKTGHSQYYEGLKKKMPVDLSALTAVEGLGPRKIRTLYQKLGIKNLVDLEKAARAGRIAKLEGFGVKSEENILRGIEFLKKTSGRFLLGDVLPLAREVAGRLGKLSGVKKVEVAGSVRRRKETVGDVDILVIADNSLAVMEHFVHMPEAARVLARGETKSAIVLKNGLQMDVRVLPPESYGAALNYFTGSKDHNVALRQLAIKKGLKLNEYGLFRKIKDQRSKIKITNKNLKIVKDEEGIFERIAGRSEEEIYGALGLDYIPPELREMTGEIEAAARHSLPKIIGYGDLRGDLQTQTNWADGVNSIEEMAEAAMKAGLEYIVITDHTKHLVVANGLDEKRILKQAVEIKKVNERLSKAGRAFRVLSGSECEILKNGDLDLPDEILAKLDVVGAAIHSYFNLSREEQTARLLKAMDNPNVDIIFHPTGRILGRRSAYDLDVAAVIERARVTRTVLEIDAFPDRLDLKDEYIRKCVEAGVKLAIDSDGHAVGHFAVLEYGLAQARRGWATREDVVNAWPVEKMLGMLKRSD